MSAQKSLSLCVSNSPVMLRSATPPFRDNAFSLHARMESEKSLCVMAGLESSHLALPLASRLMRQFRSVVNGFPRAAVFADDICTANRLYRQLDTSALMINDHTTFCDDVMPFAGLHESGFGGGTISKSGVCTNGSSRELLGSSNSPFKGGTNRFS